MTAEPASGGPGEVPIVKNIPADPYLRNQEVADPDLRKILDFAAKHNLTLYQCYPGTKYPITWTPRGYSEPVTRAIWGGKGNAVIWLPPDWVVWDADEQAGLDLVHSWDLPDHFAIRHRDKGTEKHFGLVPGGLRRSCRIRDGLDRLGNPDSKAIWVKIIDHQFGYDVISDCMDLPEWPDELKEMKKEGTRTLSRRRKGQWESVEVPAKIPWQEYYTKGIPPGTQDPELWRMACSLARQELSAESIATELWRIIEISEQDPAWPWTWAEMEDKAKRARAFIDGQDEDREEEQQKAGVDEECEALVSAAQKLFPPREELPPSPSGENLSDLQECKPIRTLAQLKRKLEAEGDDHPKSRDWDSAPEETWDLYETLYGEAFTALAAGAPEARFSWKKYSSEKFSRWKDQLAWLCKGNGAPLIEQVEGDIWRLLKDPESGDRDPYPGWDQGEPVWTKKCIGSKLRQLVYLVRAHFGGKQLTNRDVARVINQPCFRKAFGIEDCRPASEGAVSKAQVSLRKEGMCRIAEKAVHSRLNHHWKMESAAVYRTVLLLDNEVPLGAAIGAAIESAEAQKEAEREEMRGYWGMGWAA